MYDYKNETRQSLVVHSVHFYHAKHMQYYFMTCTDFMQFLQWLSCTVHYVSKMTFWIFQGKVATAYG